jgi:hypothetical protein
MSNNRFGVREVTESIMINEKDVFIVCNTTKNIDVRLVTANGTLNFYYVKNIGSGVVSIIPDCTDTIDGATGDTLLQYDAICLVDFSKGQWIKP